MRLSNYRSQFEARFHRANPHLEYEPHKISYRIDHSYTPDFYDAETDTYYETKGLFSSADRTKILAVIEQNPGINIVLVFMNPHLKLSKKSKTTYADWANRHGIEWSSAK